MSVWGVRVALRALSCVFASTGMSYLSTCLFCSFFYFFKATANIVVRRVRVEKSVLYTTLNIPPSSLSPPSLSLRTPSCSIGSRAVLMKCFVLGLCIPSDFVSLPTCRGMLSLMSDATATPTVTAAIILATASNTAAVVLLLLLLLLILLLIPGTAESRNNPMIP